MGDLIHQILGATDLRQLHGLLQDVDAEYQRLQSGGDEDDAAILAHHLEQITTDLPAWGPPPADTDGVYSYDETHYLVQAPDWRLVPRTDVVETTELVLGGDARDVIALLPGTQARRAERIGVTQQAVQAWADGRNEMSTVARHMVLSLLGYQVDAEGHWARVR